VVAQLLQHSCSDASSGASPDNQNIRIHFHD
jgi:hypothetical protein